MVLMETDADSEDFIPASRHPLFVHFRRQVALDQIRSHHARIARMSCSLHIFPFHGWGNSRTLMSHSCMIYLSWSRWHASEWMGTRLSFWTLTGCLPYLSHIWTAGLDKDRMLTRGTMVLTWGSWPFAFEHSKLKGLACRQLCQVILF